MPVGGWLCTGKKRGTIADDDADDDQDSDDSDDVNSSEHHHHHHHHFHYHHHHESQLPEVHDYDTIEDAVSQMPSHDGPSPAAVSSRFFS